MGIYLAPGNEGFAEILRSGYVDKTGLINIINQKLGTNEKLICLSRPRRFGKSFAAQMLCAYYDCSCDSHPLFDGLKISESGDYEKYINKFNVIYIDMTGIKPCTDNYADLADVLKEKLFKDITSAYPDISDDDTVNVLLKVTEITGRKFIMIIDEWDSPIRENPSVSRMYLESLRSLFKNSSVTARVFAAASM